MLVWLMGNEAEQLNSVVHGCWLSCNRDLCFTSSQAVFCHCSVGAYRWTLDMVTTNRLHPYRYCQILTQYILWYIINIIIILHYSNTENIIWNSVRLLLNTGLSFFVSFWYKRWDPASHTNVKKKSDLSNPTEPICWPNPPMSISGLPVHQIMHCAHDQFNSFHS